MSILGLAALTVFPLLMAYAAFSDLFTMQIANTVSIALVLAFVGLALGCAMPLPLLGLHLAAGAAVLVITFVLFARGWIGGGDAKLAAATAVWLGWAHLPDYALQASLLGAVLTVGILLARKRPLPPALRDRPWLARLHDAGNGVPYGIALALAGLLIYPETPLWQAALGG